MTISRQYKKIAKVAGTVGLAFMLGYSGAGVINRWKSTDEMEKIARGSDMYSVLVRDAPHDGSVSLRYMNPQFVGEVVINAEWAAQQLNVPYPFVISHWLMESGRLQMVRGFDYIKANNLGGFKKGGMPMEFDSIHSFAKAYVKLLRKDGVHDISDLDDIVGRLYSKRYVVGESELVYKTKIIHVMDKLGEADLAIRSYYAEQIDRIKNKTNAQLDAHLRK